MCRLRVPCSAKPRPHLLKITPLASTYLIPPIKNNGQPSVNCNSKLSARKHHLLAFEWFFAGVRSSMANYCSLFAKGAMTDVASVLQRILMSAHVNFTRILKASIK